MSLSVKMSEDELIPKRSILSPKTKDYDDRTRRDSTIIYIYTITVETPLGAKIQTKYHDEMTIREVLLQVCQKAGLDPREHYITFNNRELNSESSCLEAGLFQNAMLKVVKDTSSLNLDVRVSIQVKDVRLASAFPPSDNLWFILRKLCARDTFDKSLVPVVIYLRQEFIGKETMRNTTLRDLGITSGKCLLRFLQLKQEDLDQRKLKDDDVSQGTLESLELIASGPTADAGDRTIRFSPILEHKEPSVICIGGRSAVFFKQPLGLDAKGELHDEFFDTTLDEVQFMFKELQKTSEVAMSNEDMKKLVRTNLEKIKQKKLHQDETVIRIYFPNRYVIQAQFAPEETIEEVKAYIRPCLQNEDDFHLFLTSQKSKPINANQKLVDLGLVPIGKLYFDQGGPVKDQYFTRNVVSNMTSYENAGEAALIIRGQSLLRFLNYTPVYGGGMVDKIMDCLRTTFKWLRSEASIDSSVNIVPSFVAASNDESWFDDHFTRQQSTEGRLSKFHMKRKSILVTEKNKSYIEEDEKTPDRVSRKHSSKSVISKLRRRTKSTFQ